MTPSILSAVLMLLLAGASQAQTYLFTNGHLVTMGERGLIEGEVIVEGMRIVAVGDLSSVSRDHLTVIDMHGGYLMPGLAEMHAHVPRGDRDEAYMRDVLFLWLAGGITTARGMLGHESHLRLREDLMAHRELGPRLITSGPSFNGNSVSSPEQAMEMVRAQHKAGYDFLKIHPGVPRDAYDALASTARELGMTFAGHVPVDVGLLWAIEQGQTTFDHVDGYVHALVPDLTSETPGYGSFFGVGLVDQVDLERLPSLVDATREAGAWVVPTETLLENIAGDLDELLSRPEIAFLPKELLEAYKRNVVGGGADSNAAKLVGLRKTIIRALHEGGAELLLGSDSPQIFNVPGFSIHRELESVVAAGLSPFEAIATGTVNAARFFGMEDEFGRISEGLAADLILLGGNPLEDIRNTSDIQAVMVRGRWIDGDERTRRLNEISERYAE